MNWKDFFLYLTLFYVVYYAINVMIDVLRKPRLAGAQESNTYNFQTNLTEFDENPTVIEDDDPEVLKSKSPDLWSAPKEEWVNSEENSEEIEIEIKQPNPVKSTGGVTNLNSLFVLAKEGTIEMKKKVVFT
jgi:hypothetical protein